MCPWTVASAPQFWLALVSFIVSFDARSIHFTDDPFYRSRTLPRERPFTRGGQVGGERNLTSGRSASGTNDDN